MTLPSRKLFILFLFLSLLPLPSQALIPAYDRKEWLHWVDVDGDCQNTRHEVLIATSKRAVTFRTDQHCRVIGGHWYGVYLGRAYYSSEEVDIDHLVPLSKAHESGGYLWSHQMREEFANDPDNLQPVDRQENRVKGNRGPEEWRPPNRNYWCEYARRWRHVKEKYNLEVSDAEWQATQEMIDEEC